MSKLHRDNAGYIGCSYEETQDPYYSYNKLSLPLDGDINSVLREEVTFTVTVASVGGSNKYFIDGVQQATVTLLQGNVYTFDQSDNSNNNHPLRFSYTADGTHAGGIEYTLGVTKNGTPGQSGAYTRIVVPFGLHDLKYYCGQHSGMGGAANVTSNPNMTTFGLPILKTTDAAGQTLGSGNNADPYAANLVLALPMNGSNGGTSFADQSSAIKGSGSAKSISVTGNTQTSTAHSQYYGSSAYFDGSGDSLSIPNSSDFDFQSDDFTMEAWIYQTEQNSQWYQISSKYNSSTYSWWWACYANVQYCYLYPGVNLYNAGKTIPLNTWTHVAVTCKDGIAKLYQNGEVIYTIGFSGPMTTTPNAVTFGEDGDGNYDFKGYMADARIYKGVAKYYTPLPTAEYRFKAITYTGNGTGLNKIGGPNYSNGVSGYLNSLPSNSGASLFDGDTSNNFQSSNSSGSGIKFVPTIAITGSIELYLRNGDTNNTQFAYSLDGGSSFTNVTSVGGGGSYVNIGNQTITTTNGIIVRHITTAGSNTVNWRAIKVNGTVLLDGDGSTIPFSPGLVWLKNDDSYTGHHCLYDSVRGVYKHIQTSSNAAEYTESTGRGLSSFNSEGFTLDTSTNEHAGQGNINRSGQQYVAYVWNAGGAATTIAVNSLNSNSYNTSRTWSLGLSGGFDQPATNAFNGNINNQARTGGNNVQIVLTFSPPISVSTSIEVMGENYHSANFTYTATVDGTTHTISNVIGATLAKFNLSGSLTQITIDNTISGGRGYLNHVKLDGNWLVDSGVTSHQVPSRASTVSSNPAAGFSISTFTSPSSGTFSIGHKLNTAPKLVIVKTTGTGSDWSVYHASAVTNTSQYLALNSQAGLASSSTIWGDALPTSSVVGLTSGGAVATSQPCVAYCWSEVPNYSKISSYTGTGASGNVVTTGFRPAFLLIKGDIDGEDWIIMDNARTPSNPVNDAFFANTLAVPNAISAYNVDFNDDGFTVNNTNPRFNTYNAPYFYMAFAESSASDAVYEAVGSSEVKTSDLSSSPHTITNNGAVFQTRVEKFYGGATEFNGSSSNLTIPASSDFNFGTGDCTIEMWAYLKAAGSTPTLISSSNYYTSGSNGNWLLRRTNGTQIAFASYDGQGNAEYNELGAVTNLNAWHHIALTRRENTVQVFVDGSPGGTMTVTKSLSDGGTNGLRIGHANSNAYWNGYIQDVRVYKGIAKYTSSFSPPERSIQATARRYPSGVYVVS